MKIMHLRPKYENHELEEKEIAETLNRICRKLAVERSNSKRCS